MSACTNIFGIWKLVSDHKLSWQLVFKGWNREPIVYIYFTLLAFFCSTGGFTTNSKYHYAGPIMPSAHCLPKGDRVKKKRVECILTGKGSQKWKWTTPPLIPCINTPPPPQTGVSLQEGWCSFPPLLNWHAHILQCQPPGLDEYILLSFNSLLFHKFRYSCHCACMFAFCYAAFTFNFALFA